MGQQQINQRKTANGANNARGKMPLAKCNATECRLQSKQLSRGEVIEVSKQKTAKQVHSPRDNKNDAIDYERK